MAHLWDLTTAHQPVDSVGALAGKLLLQAVNDRSAVIEHHVMPTELVVRSTA